MFVVTESLCSVQDAAWLPGTQEEWRDAQRVEDSFILVFNPGPQTSTSLLQLPQVPPWQHVLAWPSPFGEQTAGLGGQQSSPYHCSGPGEKLLSVLLKGA